MKSGIFGLQRRGNMADSNPRLQVIVNKHLRFAPTLLKGAFPSVGNQLSPPSIGIGILGRCAGRSAFDNLRLHDYTKQLYICAVRGRSKTAADALFEVAEAQQGYFTSKQAASVGYLLGSQAHHVKSGNWVRVERGIYRLTHFPQSPEEQLVIYSLWSRNRTGQPEGVYSHQTALSIHELSDVNPAKLHLTVPVTFRRTARVPRVLVLHRAMLHQNDVDQRHGFAVTRPLRAIVDLARVDSVSHDIIEQALTEGRRRGLIAGQEISELRRQGQLPKWFGSLLAENKR